MGGEFDEYTGMNVMSKVLCDVSMWQFDNQISTNSIVEEAIHPITADPIKENILYTSALLHHQT